jgi:hypothetical protein
VRSRWRGRSVVETTITMSSVSSSLASSFRREHGYTSIEMTSSPSPHVVVAGGDLESQQKDSKTSKHGMWSAAVVAALCFIGTFGAMLSFRREIDTNMEGAHPLQPTVYHTAIALHMPYLGLVEPFEVRENLFFSFPLLYLETI